MEGILHMAKNGVEPLEHFAIGILAPIVREIVRDNRLVAALGLGNSEKTMQATRDNVISRPTREKPRECIAAGS